MEVSLQDKDRIFTNLYGFQPWTLDAAKKRGCWDNTKKLLQIGADDIIETIKASACAAAVGQASPRG